MQSVELRSKASELSDKSKTKGQASKVGHSDDPTHASLLSVDFFRNVERGCTCSTCPGEQSADMICNCIPTILAKDRSATSLSPAVMC